MAAIRGHAGMLLKTAGGGGGTAHRYWRILIAQSVSDVFVAIGEVEWRATPGGADLTTTSTTTAASSSASGSFLPAKTVDNIPATSNNCWVNANSAFPAWVSYDLGSAMTVEQLAIWPQYDSPAGNNRGPEDFDIQWSDDNAAWTTCDSYTGITGWAAGTGVAKTFAVTP